LPQMVGAFYQEHIAGSAAGAFMMQQRP